VVRLALLQLGLGHVDDVERILHAADQVREILGDDLDPLLHLGDGRVACAVQVLRARAGLDPGRQHVVGFEQLHQPAVRDGATALGIADARLAHLQNIGQLDLGAGSGDDLDAVHGVQERRLNIRVDFALLLRHGWPPWCRVLPTLRAP